MHHKGSVGTWANDVDSKATFETLHPGYNVLGRRLDETGAGGEDAFFFQQASKLLHKRFYIKDKVFFKSVECNDRTFWLEGNDHKMFFTENKTVCK